MNIQSEQCQPVAESEAFRSFRPLGGKACWKQWVLRRGQKVWLVEESRMQDGSEFQTAGAATLKQREAKVMIMNGNDVRHCAHHVLEELLPPTLDSQHNLRKRRHNITLPEK